MDDTHSYEKIIFNKTKSDELIDTKNNKIT